MSFQVFFCQVLQVSLRERDIRPEGYFLVFVGDLHHFSEVSGSACDLDALPEVFCEVRGVEDLIFDRFGAVDGESAGNLLFGGFLLWCLLLDRGLLGGDLGLSLFCGHGIKK